MSIWSGTISDPPTDMTIVSISTFIIHRLGPNKIQKRYDINIMQISRSGLKVLQVVLALVIIVVAALVGWFLLSLNTDTSEAQTKASLSRLEASAKVYFGRLNYYDGVCSDIGVPAAYRCHESSTAYAVEAPLPNGKYLCLDSTGFFGHTLLSKGEGTACRRY